MKKIVITEFMDESAVVSLSTAFNVVYDPKLVDDTTRLMAFVADADGIIVRNRTQVRGDLLAACAQTTVIGRLGVGLDNIDVVACEARGMQVIPATGANHRCCRMRSAGNASHSCHRRKCAFCCRIRYRHSHAFATRRLSVQR